MANAGFYEDDIEPKISNPDDPYKRLAYAVMARAVMDLDLTDNFRAQRQVQYSRECRERWMAKRAETFRKRVEFNTAWAILPRVAQYRIWITKGTKFGKSENRHEFSTYVGYLKARWLRWAYTMENRAKTLANLVNTGPKRPPGACHKNGISDYDAVKSAVGLLATPEPTLWHHWAEIHPDSTANAVIGKQERLKAWDIDVDPTVITRAVQERWKAEGNIRREPPGNGGASERSRDFGRSGPDARESIPRTSGEALEYPAPETLPPPVGHLHSTEAV